MQTEAMPNQLLNSTKQFNNSPLPRQNNFNVYHTNNRISNDRVCHEQLNSNNINKLYLQ